MNLKNNLNLKQLKKITDICKDNLKNKIDVLKSKLDSGMLKNMDRKKAAVAAGTAVCAVAVCAAAVIAMQPAGYVLADGDKTLGYIESPKALDEAAAVVETRLSALTGVKEITFDDKDITCTATKDKEIKVLDQEGIEELLMNSDLMRADACAVYINNDMVFAAATKDAAKEILDGVAKNYQTDSSELVSVAYRESVGFAQESVKVKDLVSVEDGVSILLTGQKQPKTYRIQEGDTLWDIAVANGMSATELQAMNPGFNPEVMQVGQEINLVEVHPYLTVVTTELVAANEEIAFDTVYEKTNTLYTGQKKVKTKGVKGVQKTTSQVVKENGIMVASTVVATETVSEPQAEVMYQGTKAASTFYGTGRGTGSFVNPVPIHVSSAYGSRGSGRHGGVDLRNPRGTAIRAADSGVVVFSGYSGTYGNVIRISHGNGLETLYAHCDTLGVSKGQKVSKGQQIATVGMTGRATGYHLHFEVRKNGVNQNPMSYL